MILTLILSSIKYREGDSEETVAFFRSHLRLSNTNTSVWHSPEFLLVCEYYCNCEFYCIDLRSFLKGVKIGCLVGLMLVFTVNRKTQLVQQQSPVSHFQQRQHTQCVLCFISSDETHIFCGKMMTDKS